MHARLHNFPILADWKICGLRILTEQTIKITFPPQFDHNYTASSSQADKSCTMRMFIDGTCYTYLHYTCTMCTVQCTVYSVHAVYTDLLLFALWGFVTVLRKKENWILCRSLWQPGFRPPVIGRLCYRPPVIGRLCYHPPVIGRLCYRPPVIGRLFYRPHVIFLSTSQANTHLFIILVILSCYCPVIVLLLSCYCPVLILLSSGYHPVIIPLSSCISSCYPLVIILLSPFYRPVIVRLSPCCHN